VELGCTAQTPRPPRRFPIGADAVPSGAPPCKPCQGRFADMNGSHSRIRDVYNLAERRTPQETLSRARFGRRAQGRAVRIGSDRIGRGGSSPRPANASQVRTGAPGRLPTKERSRVRSRRDGGLAICGAGRSAAMSERMSSRGDRTEAKLLRCSVCKQPVDLHGGQGRRRAALIEDGLTLCDVCAPAGNQQPVRFERE